MWKKNLKESNVKNEHLISDYTQSVPGFGFSRAIQTSLNKTRTDQDKCNHLLHKWRMKDSPHCDCSKFSTIRHIAEECPQTKYKVGINGLHKGNEGNKATQGN